MRDDNIWVIILLSIKNKKYMLLLHAFHASRTSDVSVSSFSNTWTNTLIEILPACEKHCVPKTYSLWLKVLVTVCIIHCLSFSFFVGFHWISWVSRCQWRERCTGREYKYTVLDNILSNINLCWIYIYIYK